MADPLSIISAVGVLPVIKIEDKDTAVELAAAIRAGGIGAMEVTARNETAFESIARIKAAFPDMMVGAGTITNVEMVKTAIKAGADFIVSPGFGREMVRYCVDNGIPVTPGCVSPSEVQEAQELGLRTVKFFPANRYGGVGGIKDLSGPFGKMKFIPTCGVSFDNLGEYLACPAVAAVGGSFMAKADVIARHDWQTITDNCRRAAEIALSSRSAGQARKPCPAPRQEARTAKKIVGFGDMLVSFSPAGYLRFIQADSMELNYTGAEANVLVSLAGFGMKTELVTRLPRNAISDCAVACMRKYNVGTEKIVWGGERIGVIYTERGASQRPSKVVYDRKYTAIATSVPGDYNWDEIFDEDVGWFHFTGITAALSDSTAKVCLAACKAAKAKGITVSCDLNYRKNLWTEQKARSVMEELVRYVDVLVANEEDADKVLGIRAADTDVTSGKLSREGYQDVARQICERYGVKKVGITLRKSISASDNLWSAMLYDGENSYFSREYSIHIVNRVGGGDSFTAGLIYGLSNGMDAQRTVEFAAAASCLKHSIEMDFNLVSVDEVEKLMGGDGSGRVQR